MLIYASRIMLSLLAVVLLIGLPALVQADQDQASQRGYQSDHPTGMQHAGRQHGDMHQSDHMVSHAFHRLLRHAKELGLSDDQVAKLKSALTDYKKASIRDKAEMKLAEVDVQTLGHDQKAEMPAIEEAVRKSEAARTKLRLDTITALRTAATVLTPEQREKWRSSRTSLPAEEQRHEGERAERHTEEILIADGTMLP